MATTSLVITYPDAQQARIIAALKTKFTTRDFDTGAVTVPTTQQVMEILRQYVANEVRRIVLEVEAQAAQQQAAASVTPTDII